MDRKLGENILDEKKNWERFVGGGKYWGIVGGEYSEKRVENLDVHPCTST